jgi:hypothetical protein
MPTFFETSLMVAVILVILIIGVIGISYSDPAHMSIMFPASFLG